MSWVSGNGVVNGLEGVAVFVATLPIWWDVGFFLKLLFSVCVKRSVVTSTCGVLVAIFGVSSFMLF